MAKVGKKPEGDPPKCECGCGGDVKWLRGRGWSKFVQGHHIRIKNPNNGDHVRGDRNPMRQPEVVTKMSGDNHWRHRPENEDRAEEYREEQRSLMTGEGNPNWCGGVTVHTDGRVMVRVDDHYELRSRSVMSKHLGRVLLGSEVVHHKNGDVQDDSIDNLVLFESQSLHVAKHNRARANFGLDPKDAPLCVCGCGQHVVADKRHPGQWNWFIHGHHTKRR